jgi:hypothetical protein
MIYIKGIKIVALMVALAVSTLALSAAIISPSSTAVAGGNQPDYLPCGNYQSSYVCWYPWQRDPTGSQACPTNYYIFISYQGQQNVYTGGLWAFQTGGYQVTVQCELHAPSNPYSGCQITCTP